MSRDKLIKTYALVWLSSCGTTDDEWHYMVLSLCEFFGTYPKLSC